MTTMREKQSWTALKKEEEERERKDNGKREGKEKYIFKDYKV